MPCICCTGVYGCAFGLLQLSFFHAPPRMSAGVCIFHDVKVCFLCVWICQYDMKRHGTRRRARALYSRLEESVGDGRVPATVESQPVSECSPCRSVISIGDRYVNHYMDNKSDHNLTETRHFWTVAGRTPIPFAFGFVSAKLAPFRFPGYRSISKRSRTKSKSGVF